MWIRSKDKTTLVNTLRILISGKRIINAVYDDEYDNLGEYETRERAIQVLTLVQENIADYEYARICQDVEDAPQYIIFEMPNK